MTDAAIEDDAFALLGPVFAGRSALLLEDDPALAEHVEARLRRAGFARVDRFDAGEDALGAAAGHAYDVLILDRLTTGLDGLETLKRLRASSGPSAQAPALMLTAPDSRPSTFCRSPPSSVAPPAPPCRPRRPNWSTAPSGSPPARARSNATTASSTFRRWSSPSSRN
jgi:CheY-like chemotaxis protein